MSHFPIKPRGGKLTDDFIEAMIEMWLAKGQDVFSEKTLTDLRRQMSNLSFDETTTSMWHNELNEWRTKKAA